MVLSKEWLVTNLVEDFEPDHGNRQKRTYFNLKGRESVC